MQGFMGMSTQVKEFQYWFHKRFTRILNDVLWFQVKTFLIM